MLLHHEGLMIATDMSLSTLGWCLSAAATWLAIGVDALRRKLQRARQEDR